MSFRFEKVVRPSNREDICYLNRGQLGLSNVVAVDLPEKIEAVLPKLDALIEQGLVTTEEVRIVIARPRP